MKWSLSPDSFARVSLCTQLTSVMESLNEELKEVESSAADIVCVNGVWSRFSAAAQWRDACPMQRVALGVVWHSCGIRRYYKYISSYIHIHVLWIYILKIYLRAKIYLRIFVVWNTFMPLWLLHKGIYGIYKGISYLYDCCIKYLWSVWLLPGWRYSQCGYNCCQGSVHVLTHAFEFEFS